MSLLRSPTSPMFLWAGAAIVAVTAIATTAIAVFLMYRAGFQEERRDLVDIARTQAALIESVARFDRRTAAQAPEAYGTQAREATLGQIREALHEYRGLGESGELVLGRRTADDRVHIVLHQRHTDHQASPDHRHAVHDHQALALRRALDGQEGAVVGPDFTGTRVLAAYVPLPELDMGLVAKKDLAEIRSPYLVAGLQTAGIGLGVILVALTLGRWLLRPLLDRVTGLSEVINLLSASAPGMIYRASAEPQRTLELAGDGVRRFIGRTPEALTEPPGTPLASLIHPADHATVADGVQKSLDSGQPLELTYRLRTQEGGYRWVQDYAQPAVWHNRRVLYGLLFDVTATHQLAEERERLVAVLDASPDLVGIADRELRPVYMNEGGRRLLGIDPKAPLDEQTIADYSPAWAWRILRDTAIPAAEREGAWQGDLALLGPDGGEFPVSQVVLAHRDLEGGVVYYSTVARDMTERYRLEQALARQRQEFRNVVTRANTGMVVVDPDGEVLFSNPAAQSLLGKSKTELEGAPLGIPVAGPGVSEVQIPAAGGHVRIAEIAVTDTEWDEQPAHLAMLHDITARREAEAAMEHMAYHDNLTGLPNRALLSKRIAAAVSEARVTGNMIAVLFLDLDHFKTINDSLGHSTGDRLLQVVTERIRKTLRRSDTVARMGGDEFAVLLEGIDDDAVPMRIAEHLRNSLQTPVRLDDHELVTECSIGISLYPQDALDADILIQHADTAMYAAKSQGRNLVMRYSEAQGASVAGELRTRSRLRQALQDREFVLLYQPQVSLGSEAVVGYEALLRWEHPEQGLLTPDLFMPALEDTGLIEPVGGWVLRQAFRQAAAWSKDEPEAVMGVNLAAHQLRHAQVTETVLEAVDSAGLSRSQAALEITESTALTNLEHTRRVLSQLRRAGLRILLDDFGTGYSSLKYLHQLPVDIVKIDKGFVQALPRPEAVSLIRAIISMTHSLGLAVLAEGVETMDQARFLREAGCDYGQGFLYGRPLRATEPVEREPGKQSSG